MCGRSMTAVVVGVVEFTGQVRCENGVGTTTVERGPIISDLGNIDMEEKSRGDPHDQPRQDQQMPQRACLNHWYHRSLPASTGMYKEGALSKDTSVAAKGRS